MPNTFYPSTKTISDRTSVHTLELLQRRDFCDGAKMRRADLESGASHIGYVLCDTLVQCEHFFGPVAEANKQECGLVCTKTEVNI